MVAGRLFQFVVVSDHAVAPVENSDPLAVLPSVTNRRSLALVGVAGSAGTVKRTNGW